MARTTQVSSLPQGREGFAHRRATTNDNKSQVLAGREMTPPPVTQGVALKPSLVCEVELGEACEVLVTQACNTVKRRGASCAFAATDELLDDVGHHSGEILASWPKQLA